MNWGALLRFLFMVAWDLIPDLLDWNKYRHRPVTFRNKAKAPKKPKKPGWMK